MSGNQHPKSRPEDRPTQSDLDRNPGIGQSKGTFATGEDPTEIEGDNTVKGDTENDTTPQGGVNPEEGRTNR